MEDMKIFVILRYAVLEEDHPMECKFDVFIHSFIHPFLRLFHKLHQACFVDQSSTKTPTIAPGLSALSPAEIASYRSPTSCKKLLEFSILQVAVGRHGTLQRTWEQESGLRIGIV